MAVVQPINPKRFDGLTWPMSATECKARGCTDFAQLLLPCGNCVGLLPEDLLFPFFSLVPPYCHYLHAILQSYCGQWLLIQLIRDLKSFPFSLSFKMHYFLLTVAGILALAVATPDQAVKRQKCVVFLRISQTLEGRERGKFSCTSF